MCSCLLIFKQAPVKFNIHSDTIHIRAHVYEHAKCIIFCFHCAELICIVVAIRDEPLSRKLVNVFWNKRVKSNGVLYFYIIC